jgi:hypothetical protein
MHCSRAVAWRAEWRAIRKREPTQGTQGARKPRHWGLRKGLLLRNRQARHRLLRERCAKSLLNNTRSRAGKTSRRSGPHAPSARPTKFPLTLAGLLQRMFEGVVASPLPKNLAGLLRRVKSNKTKDQDGTKPSRRVAGGYDAELDGLTAARQREPPPEQS